MLYPLPVVMVSMADVNGKNNIITIGWAGTVCTNPPMVSISVRPERYSYPILKETGEFVINLTTKELVYATDYCGVKSGRDVDKFAAVAYDVRTANGIRYVPTYTNAVLSCQVIDMKDVDTQIVFIADVVEARVLSNAPSCTYGYYHAHIKPKKNPAPERGEGWVCRICGYVYEGEELPEDFICPLCKHGAADFEPIG